jgi:hypothetical protein
LDIGDNLYRRIKAKAAMEGRTVTELVEAGLRTVIETPANDSIAELAWKRFAGVMLALRDGGAHAHGRN